MEVKALDLEPKKTQEKMADDGNFGQELKGRRLDHPKKSSLDAEKVDFRGKPEDPPRHEIPRSWRTLESKMEGFRRKSYEQPREDAEIRSLEKKIEDSRVQNPDAKRHDQYYQKNQKLVVTMKMEDFGQNPEKTKQKPLKEDSRPNPEKSENLGQIPGETRRENPKNDKASSLVWDCGSTLYDSFELNSFKRQLDSAIITASSARTMSMPHLSDGRLPQPQPLPPPHPPSSSSGKKSSNKISRSVQKFLKSLFKLPIKHSSAPSSPVFKACRDRGGDMIDQYYVVYDKSTESLTTIPEAAEMDHVGPEISSLVRRTASERFAAARTVGISCA